VSQDQALWQKVRTGKLTVGQSYWTTKTSMPAGSKALIPVAKPVLLEQRQRKKPREHSLSPRRKLLFIGPPGSGKTMTASALAGELNLPLFTIMPEGLITKFMGETAARLRLVFDAKICDILRSDPASWMRDDVPQIMIGANEP
jgi:MoxR-like ATPase